MTDIASYDAAEARAIEGARNWLVLSEFRPKVFQTCDFPVRVDTLAQTRMLMDSMHGGTVPAIQAELNGLREPDLNLLAGGLARIVAMQQELFADPDVVVPIAELLAHYLVARKILGFPEHSRILDIGPGAGYLALFLSERPEITVYNQIEVTQSLYILQGHINRMAYGTASLDMSCEPATPIRLFTRDSVVNWPKLTAPAHARFERRVRNIRYPWWRIDDAFDQTYDIVTMNENICEMSEIAFAYYVGEIRRTLAPEGYLLIHGVGATSQSPTVLDDRLNVLERLGFRAVVLHHSKGRGGPFVTPNLILVPPGHPRHEGLRAGFRLAVLDKQDALVRSVFGLDAETGRTLDLPDLTRELTDRVRRILSGPENMSLS